MRGGARARLGPRFRGAAQRDWPWLAVAVAVAAGLVVSLVAFGNFESNYRVAASGAAAAELAASRVNALEWQSIAEGSLPPATGTRIRELLGTTRYHLTRLGPGAAAARRQLAAYRTANETEQRLIRAGRAGAARRLDRQRVDPQFAVLSASVQQLATANSQAAAGARRMAVAGDIVVVCIGLAVVAGLVLRFGAARRALATAEVERRVLRQTDRAKTDLISVVSHDLRTPLTSIAGYLELISEEDAGPLTGEQRQFLAVMRRNTERLSRIVNDLLFIFRARKGTIKLDREQVSLGGAAAGAVESQGPEARQKGIDLRIATVPSPEVSADRHRVDELIENLLSNAVKFTPDGGSVQVTVRPADGLVQLEVTDTGKGISPEDEQHLFEQFFRSREAEGMPGVGLGLSIVKAIADAHHASVTVRSRLGEGTTFRVEFPVSGRPPGGPGPGSR